MSAQQQVKLALHDVGEESRAHHPGYGWCLGCGRSVREVNMHEVPLGGGLSAAPACEECWEKSTLRNRVTLAAALARVWLLGELRLAFSPKRIKRSPLIDAVRREWEQEHAH